MGGPPVSAEQAVRLIESGQRVFVHGGVATPKALLDALVAQAGRLRGVELIHLHTELHPPYAVPALRESFRVASLFVGPTLRSVVDHDQIDYLPCSLSEIPSLFRSGRRPIDVALLQVSTPDAQGFCSLGTSIDVARAAFECATRVIAQVNPKMPRTHGDSFVPLSRFDAWVHQEEPLFDLPSCPIGEEEHRIGQRVAELVEDGDCLQAGIGAVPDAVLRSLRGHRDLGVHTEMWSDGMLELLKCGAVTNARKRVHPGKTVASFVMGSSELYRFIDDHPALAFLTADYVNDPNVIARNRGVVAINSAVEIDLTGQVCADSVGSRIISGVGGQMDFMRGAALSPGGKPIIAIRSRTPGGQSKIVSLLKPGAGVVTPRAYVHFVVTEHGVADLYGKTLGERARALIAIAHPEDRERLEVEWRRRA